MTEREVVLRERAAAAKAIEWVCARARRDYGINSGIDGLDTRRYVEETFPLPTVTRPRVVRIEDKEYRIRDGVIEYRVERSYGLDHWRSSSRDLGEIKALADLIANPTETVPEDA